MVDPDRGEKESEIAHLTYLALMGLCVLITLPLEFVFRARVYRRPRALVIALVAVVIVFSVWDVYAIKAGHWTYNARYVSGIDLPGGLPLEEVVFFVVIPICGLLSYEAVGTVLSVVRRRGRPAAEKQS